MGMRVDPTHWSDTKNGGLIMRTNKRNWLARPCNKLGSNTILFFTNEKAALQYANTPTDWNGWGERPVDEKGNPSRPDQKLALDISDQPGMIVVG